MHSLKKLFYLFVLSIFTQICIAQELSYAEILYEANKLYEAGNFTDAIEKVNSCSLKKVSQAEKWKAYRLLALCYIEDNQIEFAQKAAKNMLSINPTYKPNVLKDPTELITLLKKLKVIPKFSLGLAFSLGSNITFPSINKSYVVSDYKKTYTSKNNLLFGVSLGYNFNEKIGLDIGLQSSNKSYEIDFAFNSYKVNYKEDLSYLNIPIGLKYNFKNFNKIELQINAGGYFGYLLFARNNIKLNYFQTNTEYEILDLNAISRRNKTDYGGYIGLGISYPIKFGKIHLQSNYFHSLTNITNEENRYKYKELIFNYFYIDDDIILNNLTINAGISFYINYKVLNK